MQADSTLQAVLFFCLLLAASVWDLRKRIIPDSICLLIALTGLIDFSPVNLLGVLAALPLLLAALYKPEGIGGGDIKLTAAAGMSGGKLADALYTEMAEFGFLTKYIFGSGIEEIDINSWKDIEVQYSDGRTVKLEERFESPQHAVNVIRRMLHISGMAIIVYEIITSLSGMF